MGKGKRNTQEENEIGRCGRGQEQSESKVPKEEVHWEKIAQTIHRHSGRCVRRGIPVALERQRMDDTVL
jgi:hypothetical protein